MADPPNLSRVRSLVERLVALPSVSPDPAGEAACAAAIRAALPPALESGEWRLPDGRPVVWAHLRGRSGPAALLLTHYDTVGIAEYAALGAPEGEAIALHPPSLRERLLALDPRGLPPAAAADLEEERRSPGTWMFGRGALDMKSGVAAGIAALEALSAGEPDDSVVFVACPDEENQSAGMLRAVEELARLREREGLELAGAISLDYGDEPVLYDGVAGKLLVGLWVLGAPTHVGDPFGGADAVQLAAAIVSRLTVSKALVEGGPGGGGVPPVALQLRDLKPRYDVQTALEAHVELNVLTHARPLARTLEVLREETAAAMAELSRSMVELRQWTGRGSGGAGAAARVLTYPELRARAGRETAADALGGEPVPTDMRLATFERVRRLARAARLTGPAVVIALLPPYYPHATPRPGGLGERLRPLLARHGLEVRQYYPFVTDASYLAWRADGPADVEAHLPALGREYRLPIEAARALDLDVVTLGPWGRDAHGLYERVHAPYAFGILPRLVVATVQETLRGQPRAAKETP